MFYCLKSAGPNLGVFDIKISILHESFVIICAIRAEASLDILEPKINLLRQKLVIICATRTGATLGDLAFKIYIYLKICHYLCQILFNQI